MDMCPILQDMELRTCKKITVTQILNVETLLLSGYYFYKFCEITDAK